MLGWVNVDAMLRQINLRQFHEWGEYAQLEPFDETRADLRAASIVQATANAAGTVTHAVISAANRRTAPRPKPVKLDDCLLKFGPPVATPATDQRAAVRDGFAAWARGLAAAQKQQERQQARRKRRGVR